MLQKLDKFLNSFYRASGYLAAIFLILILCTIVLGNAHIRITLFLEKAKGKLLKFLTIWCLAVSTFFSGFLAFYFIKMWFVSIQLAERSQGADEILLWIPQTGVAIGSIIFFICITHNFIKIFTAKSYD